MGETEPEIRPGLWTSDLASNDPVPTEQLLSQGEKACWEEKLTQVGREPGLRGLLRGQREWGVSSKPQWMGCLLSPRRKRGGGRKGEPHFTDEQTGLQRGEEETSSWGWYLGWI